LSCTSGGAFTTHTASSAPDQRIDGCADDRVRDGFQLGERRRVGKDDASQHRAVNATIRIQDELTESIDDWFISRCAGSHRLMCQAIRVNGIRTEMLQHLANDALPNGDIPRETDYVFIWPTTHGRTSKFDPQG
jgi:hypothetical protein